MQGQEQGQGLNMQGQNQASMVQGMNFDFFSLRTKAIRQVLASLNDIKSVPTFSTKITGTCLVKQCVKMTQQVTTTPRSAPLLTNGGEKTFRSISTYLGVPQLGENCIKIGLPASENGLFL